MLFCNLKEKPMAARDDRAGLTALNRFGFGPRGDGDLAAAAQDPRGFLRAELEQPGLALLSGPGLAASPAALQNLFAFQDMEKAEREKTQGAQKIAMAQITPAPQVMDSTHMETAAKPQDPPKEPPKPPRPEQTAYRAEALARLARAFNARVGLVERLVAFWSNHFAISIAKGGPTHVTAGAFEREAIRPYVLGRFSDMLLAAESHPAMLFYLDAQQSIGPGSPVGQKQNKGLNENLGREILELHTLGVDGGYRQTDVIALSNMLTGWRFAGREAKDVAPGAFQFQANVHQPGPQDLLGADYPQAGQDQARAALVALARRPETARHLARKLARHFISDAPPPALVERLAQAYLKTDGDLRAVTLAMIDAPDSWGPPTKIRTPWEFCLGAARLLNRSIDDPGPTLNFLNLLGQPLWRPPGPNGFSDDTAAWASPEGMKLRLDLAAQWTAKLREPPDPRELLDSAFGEAASAETRQAVSHAETRPQGLALLLMAPEAQRR
jgi:uncharacterized protein (DUF1800 family)